MFINEISMIERGKKKLRVAKINKGITIIQTVDCHDKALALAKALHYMPELRQDESLVRIKGDRFDELDRLAEINLVASCKEYLDCRVFYPETMNYSQRLLWYKKCDDYYGKKDFDNITGGIGHFKFFRAYLCSFIRDFKPTVLSEEKGLEIHIKNSGEFFVKKRSAEECDLCALEKLLFEYYCFIELNRFWEGFAKLFSQDIPKLPLLISGFIEMVGNYDLAVNHIRKNKTDGQIIIFCGEDAHPNLRTWIN